MARVAAARRHAQAVFQIALERDELDKWQQDLTTIATVLAEPQLVAVLESPKVRFQDKIGLVRQALPGISPLAMNLVSLLITRGRLRVAAGIASEYQRLLDAHRGVEHAEVTAAIPLDAEDRDRLQARLASLLEKEIVLEAKVDPSLMGGLVARIGDKLIDGSTKSRLLALKRNLIERAR